MPAERKPIPADLLKWFNYKSRTRGRDWFVDVVHLSPHTIAKIREDGKATPSCIAKIERARNNDPSYRKEVSYKHAVEKLKYLVADVSPRLYQSGNGIGPYSRDKIIAALGLEVLDEMAVKADLLPPAD